MGGNNPIIKFLEMVLVYMKINILLMFRVLRFYVSNIIMTHFKRNEKNYIENVKRRDRGSLI